MRRVLFSVTDKTGLEGFAKGLIRLFPKLEILASGGTAKLLEKEGIPHLPIAAVTGFPECFGGRVKTLHPAILGGILFRRGIDEAEARELEIEPIDLVVCNLYRFDPGLDVEKQIDAIDIGGSTMIRAAVKSFSSVGVVVDPKDYDALLAELKKDKTLSLETKRSLAAKAMALSAEYEAAIARAFTVDKTRIELENGRKLPYGENPDQEGWVYSFAKESGIASSKVFGGKALSYNNYEDASQAFFALKRIADGGKTPAAAIVKHGGLCGFATAKTLKEAFQRAWDGDPKSAFGSIVALSQEAGVDFCEALKGRFVEVVLAPSFSPKFLEWVSAAKPSLRLVEANWEMEPTKLYRGISGGMLMQTPKRELAASDVFLKPLSGGSGVATRRFPKTEQTGLFRFALAATQSVKSNAIVLAREYETGCYQTIGIGGGQPNRIDSLQRLALPKAIENLRQEGKLDARIALSEIVLASDGFFPFPDSIAAAADAGIQLFLQPGGSVKDEEVTCEADKRGLCMIFTGQRYFSH